MIRLPMVAWIGNAAAALCGRWGSVSQQAREARCSRQTVYEHARRVKQALAQIHQGGPALEELQRDNARLRQENQRLQEAQEKAILFPEAKQQEFTAIASAMGVSLEQIRQLLSIVLPENRCPSRSKLGRWLTASAARAGEILEVLDQASQWLVRVLALDEIFLGCKPVLVGVEPASMAWMFHRTQRDLTCSATVNPS